MSHDTHKKEAGFALYLALGLVVIISAVTQVLQAQLDVALLRPIEPAGVHELHRAALESMEIAYDLAASPKNEATTQDITRCRFDSFRRPALHLHSYRLAATPPVTRIIFIQTLAPLGHDANAITITACAYNDSNARHTEALWYYDIYFPPFWYLLHFRVY